MQKHFTGTAFTIYKDQVLLLFHKKLKSWLPPGGHIEENELPHECAIRETKEETGIDIEIISDSSNFKPSKEAFEIPSSFICLEEHIPKHENKEEHKHIDLIFIAKPKGDFIFEKEFENSFGELVKWFSLDEINKIPNEEIFSNCRQICEKVLK